MNNNTEKKNETSNKQSWMTREGKLALIYGVKTIGFSVVLFGEIIGKAAFATWDLISKKDSTGDEDDDLSHQIHEHHDE